jgi:hypothetical protein
LVRSTLAIYITLSAVAVVGIAQILYWKLVVSSEGAADRAAADGSRPEPGLGPMDAWAGAEAHALGPVEPWAGLEDDAREPERTAEPVLVGA